MLTTSKVDALHEAPDFVPTAAKGVPGAGSKKERGYGSGEKTQKVLGIQFRSLKETARDTVASLREGGWAEGS